MLPRTRQFWKQALWLTRVKLVYARITLTRFTTLYFFFALLNCIVLVILQSTTLADNSLALNINNSTSDDAHGMKTIPVFSNGVLQMCNGLPGQNPTCVQIFPPPVSKRGHYEVKTLTTHDDDGDDDDKGGDDDEGGKDRPAKDSLSSGSPLLPGQAQISAPSTAVSNPASPVDFCASTMIWFDDVLKDEKREDIVALIFNIWLLSLGIVTVLNESLPHLGASLAGHVLGTGWAAFRVASNEKLRHNYEIMVVQSLCPTIFHDNWWDVRRSHTIPILVVNVLVLVAMAFLSFKLFKVYATQSFSRVGASSEVSRIYKTILVFSASLQLTAFFALASTTMWIDHICFGEVEGLAHHGKLYLAAFVVTLLLLFPWLLLGWMSVRKEGPKRFLIFFAISAFLVAVSTLMFFSDLYRFIFNSWPFFATVSITSFVLTIATTLLGLCCRLNFGKGLAHYLQVTDALDGVDFTPVNFSKDDERAVGYDDALGSDGYLDEKYPVAIAAGYVQQPELSYQYGKKTRRGQSVYSEKNGVSVKLSSTPSLFQERERAAQRARSTRRDKVFGGDNLNLTRDGYTQPQMPPKSATVATSRPRSRDLTSSPRSSVSSSASSSPSPSRSASPPITVARPGLPANPKMRPSGV